jgi:hypothetical protein
MNSPPDQKFEMKTSTPLATIALPSRFAMQNLAIEYQVPQNVW